MLAWASPVAAEPAEVASETPFPGVTYTTWRDDDLPADIYSVELDLTSNEIDLVATADVEGQRGVTPTAFAAAVGAAVVVNGDYFKPAGFVPAGIARGGAVTWSTARDDARSGFVRFHRGVTRIEVDFSPPSEVVEELPDAEEGTVGGRPMLMQNGQLETTFDCEDGQAMPCDPAPRTAVAVSADRNTMWLVVVDGWQAGSIGMTAAELADFAQDQLGADDAMMLDGGSASAMWVDGALKSSPSDGVERPVANHIAVKTGVPVDGLLLGHVFEKVIDGPRITGALVTLDDGRSKTYDGAAVWSFATRPRWACVTATADGYHEDTQCRHVPADAEKYASITMIPSDEYIDGGPGEVDAGAVADAGTNPGADAGSDGGGTGVCGCGQAGPGTGGPGIAFTAGVFVAALLLLRQRSRQKAAQGTRDP
jgi:hypothetical protein